jgi:hypothetical protein
VMRLNDGGMIDRSHEMYGKSTPCDANEDFFVFKNTAHQAISYRKAKLVPLNGCRVGSGRSSRAFVANGVAPATALDNRAHKPSTSLVTTARITMAHTT